MASIYVQKGQPTNARNFSRIGLGRVAFTLIFYISVSVFVSVYLINRTIFDSEPSNKFHMTNIIR